MSEDGIRDLLTDICLVGAAATSVAWVLLINRGRMARVANRIAKTSRSAIAAFLFFAAIATVCAQKSGTNEPPRGASSPRVIESGPSVTPEDVARGYMLESVTTNAAYSYTMPTNATRYEKWWRRGAYEDVHRLDLGDFRFPLGTYMCDYLWTYTNQLGTVSAFHTTLYRTNGVALTVYYLFHGFRYMQWRVMSLISPFFSSANCHRAWTGGQSPDLGWFIQLTVVA